MGHRIPPTCADEDIYTTRKIEDLIETKRNRNNKLVEMILEINKTFKSSKTKTCPPGIFCGGETEKPNE